MTSASTATRLLCLATFFYRLHGTTPRAALDRKAKKSVTFSRLFSATEVSLFVPRLGGTFRLVFPSCHSLITFAFIHSGAPSVSIILASTPLTSPRRRIS